MSYTSVAKALPGRIRKNYSNMLQYSGVKLTGERFLGFSFIFGLAASATISYSLALFLGLELGMALLSFALGYALFEGGIYMWLWMKVEGRRSNVEAVLPDALQIMAMNVRSGLTTERALILAARPEFGILEKELKRAGKEVLAGKDLKKSMLEISTRVKSKDLENTMKLLVDGINSGGELARLLEQTASDLQNTKMMEKEVRASVLMYVIFIFFAVGIGAPLIFGISTHLVEVLSEQMGRFDNIDIPDPNSFKVRGVSPFGGISTFQGLSVTSMQVSPDFLMIYAILSLMVTSFFGGLVIGVIKDGEEKKGVKLIPILMGMSIALFFLTKYLAATFFAI